jgi:glycosyltransferase involved in cell wall biosynthesis
VPAKIGPARRNHHILEQISRHYEVTVVAVGLPEHADAIVSGLGGRIAKLILVPPKHDAREKFLYKLWRTATGRCDYLPAVQQSLRNACAEVARSESFDAVMFSCVLLGGLPVPKGVPVVVDTHNAEFDVHRRTAMLKGAIGRRLYAACQYWPTRREEQRQGARAELLLATSSRDRELFEQSLHLPRVAVVPNGIDLAEFTPRPQVDSRVILFSALMSYYPNQHGIRWFLDAVLPLVLRRVPDARMVVAGADPPAWLLAHRSHNVDVTGPVADMRPYIAGARVVVAPLMIGGGTRVKILEAQAMERAVVSTAIGAEGLSQRHDETILIGDDAESFAAHVVRLLNDPNAAARIARAGRRHVVQHFDWNHIGTELSRLLNARLGLSAAEPPSNPWRTEDRTHGVSTLSHKRIISRHAST